MSGCRSASDACAPDRHHQRDRGVGLLLRPLLGGVEVAAPVGPADHVAHAPLQHRIAVLPEHLLSRLLPDPVSARLETSTFEPTPPAIVLTLTSRSHPTPCPLCSQPPTRTHTAVRAAGLNGLDEGQRVTHEMATERGKEVAANLACPG